MADSCEHYWTPNGAYFCVHCGADSDTVSVTMQN